MILPQSAIEIAYLFTGATFIFAIRRLSSPATASQGNRIAAFGMLVAIVFTFFSLKVLNLPEILIAMLVGAIVGAVAARKVRMTAMPQMVALFNGMGGGAAALISAQEYNSYLTLSKHISSAELTTILLSTLIGSISFTGSMIAFAKLQEIMTGRPITYPGQHFVNMIIFAVILAMGGYLYTFSTPNLVWYGLFGAAAGLFGILMVIPIGGADMPVVISLLNSFTGLAAAITGFVLDNYVLIIAGALVGASGTILTRLMSKAMNRSLFNIMFGAFGARVEQVATDTAEGRTVRSGTPEDVATLLAFSRSVIIVPGYGLAVARAQQELKELADLLERRGVQVRYAIHPVAGRMPGHMNVLLAEVNVPYSQLYEMDDINPEFSRTDVALVVGANDVTNPAARTKKDSPLYGMPILNVDQAANIVVLKRSMNPGFAGIDNELFYNPKTIMLFGDAKDSLSKLVAEIKQIQ